MTVPYKVEYFQNPSSPVDITQYVVSVKMKRQGTGFIRTASLMLDALEGAFISNSNAGNTPIISAFDMIRITFTDDSGATKFGIFLADANLKQVTEQGKSLLPLEMLGRERSLQDIKTTAYFNFRTPNFSLENMRLRYNRQQGDLQPSWLFIDPNTNINWNQSPSNLINVYDFSSGSMSYYDAIMQLIARLNQPTDFGGSGTFYSVVCEDVLDLSGNWQILVKIFEQGTTTGPIPTLSGPETDPFVKVTTQKNPPQGTQVLVRGAPNTGSMPPDFHRFASYVEMINNIPAYISTATYAAGIRVVSGGIIYQSLGGVPISTPPPNALYWKAVTATEIIDSFIASEYPTYDPTQTYAPNFRIGYQGVAYSANVSVPPGQPPPNATYWSALTINYSLWTNNKAVVTQNSCSNPDHTVGQQSPAFSAPAFPDGNLVIRDRMNQNESNFIFFRDFVLVRAKNDSDIKSDSRMKHYLMGANNDTFYVGFTVLVDSSLGPVGGAFVGEDIYGNPYSDSIVQFDGYEWVVLRVPAVGDQVGVLFEGKVYEYNNSPISNQNYFGNAAEATPTWSYKSRNGTAVGPYSWMDVSGTAGGNDCFHAPSAIESVEGLLATSVNGQDYSSYIANSALRITYQFSLADATYQAAQTLWDKLTQTATKFLSTLGKAQVNSEFTFSTAEILSTFEQQFYNYGWWYALPFPYPLTSFNGITEGVGGLYGYSIASNPSEFSGLNLLNPDYSHAGEPGFNHYNVSDMGGPFTGMQFYFLFNILLNGAEQPFQGNIPFTMTIYDDLRNVWRADFTYRMLGDPQLIQLQFSQFTINRPSRIPIQIDTVVSNFVDIISPAELLLQNIFETKKVRLITIQLKQSYDEYERFNPASLDTFIRTLEAGFVGTVSFQGTIDGFGLVKAPFVSSGIVLDRVINPPPIDAPNVRNYIQLKSIAMAESQIAGFPFEQYTVVRHGKCEFDVEQSVYLNIPDLINESDDGYPNTRKLIMMADELSYDHTQGFLTTKTLTKRLGGP